MTDKRIDVSQLAGLAKCTRAAIHNYLNGKNKTIEALLLFNIAECLDVSPSWLLKNAGQKARVKELGPEERHALEIFGKLDNGSREFWLNQGEDLHRRELGLVDDVMVRHRDEAREPTVPPKIKRASR